MSPPTEAASVAVTLFLGGVGLVLLLARSDRGRGVRAALDRGLRRVTGSGDLRWLSWWHLALLAALVYGAVAGFNLATGAYACGGPGQESDLIGFLNSGRALLAGHNPFTVPDCGTSIPEPYGFASIALSALGSPAGALGIATVWGVVAVALVPLTWAVAGPDRRYLTLVVLSSPLYLPLVITQIDGASNALIPVAVLGTLYLAQRGEGLAATVGGVLATGRFPALFPIVAGFGPRRRRYLLAGISVGVFGAITAATYAVWRSAFLDFVFFSQVSRRSFSLNAFEIPQHAGLLPSGPALPALQAVLTIAVVAVAFYRERTSLRAAALPLVGIALLTQYLSFNLLVALLPVALVNARARWWLWAVGVVGSLNYIVAYSDWAVLGGSYGPTEALDLLLTALLLGLFFDLARRDPATRTGAPPPVD